MPKILIVDDDVSIQEGCTSLFLDEGYQVINAGTGEEGMHKIAKFQPDLLLLDIAMPGMDGRSLLLNLKRIARDLPVIIMSGKEGMQEDPEIKMSKQVYRFFQKPVDLLELNEAIRSILHQTSQEFTWRQKKLGGCTLRRCIGQGGGGLVYEATRGGKSVAIKILTQATAERVERLRREARGMVQLSHPNILKLLDIGYTDEGVYFLITEFFPGKSLEEMLEIEGSFSEKEATEIVNQTAMGMATAHHAGIIHRDIKPSNILYRREENLVKVIDFGIAREIRANLFLTHHGTILGSPVYMSPEQCRGETADHRSDIYNLGITFYNILVGDIPFAGSSIAEIFAHHLFKSVAWPQNPAISPPVRAIVEKMLAKLPRERYQSMEEIADILGRI